MNEYRVKVKHLTEDNAHEAIPGELLISKTSGHISVKGKSEIVSRTKNLEARIASIKDVTRIMEHVLNTVNGDHESIYGCEIKDCNSWYDIVENIDYHFKDFRIDINFKYQVIKQIEAILENIDVKLLNIDKEMVEYREKVDQQSVDILKLEGRYTDIICDKLLEVKYILKKHELNRAVIDNNYKYLKNKYKVINEDTTDITKRYIEVASKLFGYTITIDENTGAAIENYSKEHMIDNETSHQVTIKVGRDEKRNSISHNEFIRRTIGIIYNQHDIAEYTPYKTGGE